MQKVSQGQREEAVSEMPLQKKLADNELELAKDRDHWREMAEDLKRKLLSTQIMLKHYEPNLRGVGADNLLWQIEQNQKALQKFDEAGKK
jgi:hypothetical protein